MILSWFISLLTFPGVVLHELAHKKFCDFCGVPVYKVSYFRIGNPVGQVIHAEPRKYSQVFWISVGPLIINSIVALLASYFFFYGGLEIGWRIFLLWLAFSAGIHAFPSDQDTGNIIEASKNRLTFFDLITFSFLFRWISLLFVYPIKWANNARYFWFFYALILIALGFLI